MQVVTSDLQALAMCYWYQPCLPRDVISRGAAQESKLIAGHWRGLEVAIKTVIFQVGMTAADTAQVASEAAIASNLVHENIVNTYNHDMCCLQDNDNNELEVYKFYLIQECAPARLLRPGSHVSGLPLSITLISLEFVVTVVQPGWVELFARCACQQRLVAAALLALCIRSRKCK